MHGLDLASDAGADLHAVDGFETAGKFFPAHHIAAFHLGDGDGNSRRFGRVEAAVASRLVGRSKMSAAAATDIASLIPAPVRPGALWSASWVSPWLGSGADQFLYLCFVAWSERKTATHFTGHAQNAISVFYVVNEGLELRTDGWDPSAALSLIKPRPANTGGENMLPDADTGGDEPVGITDRFVAQRVVLGGKDQRRRHPVQSRTLAGRGIGVKNPQALAR